MGDLPSEQEYPGQRQPFSYFAGEDTAVERPLPVTLIAILQFAKAWSLLMVAVIARVVPEALRGVAWLPSFLYFASHGRDIRGPLLPIVGVYVAVIGCGLWRLWGWARRSLILSSGLMVGLWAYRFLNNYTIGRPASKLRWRSRQCIFSSSRMW